MNDLIRRWKGKQAASVAGNSSKTLFTDRKGGMCDEVVWICRILIMIQPLQTQGSECHDAELPEAPLEVSAKNDNVHGHFIL